MSRKYERDQAVLLPSAMNWYFPASSVSVQLKISFEVVASLFSKVGEVKALEQLLLVKSAFGLVAVVKCALLGTVGAFCSSAVDAGEEVNRVDSCSSDMMKSNEAKM